MGMRYSRLTQPLVRDDGVRREASWDEALDRAAAGFWLGIDVGTDIPLANAIAREIMVSELVNTEFVERATEGFDDYRKSVEPWTLDEAARVTGVPADAIREAAHAYARAGRAQLCWTL